MALEGFDIEIPDEITSELSTVAQAVDYISQKVAEVEIQQVKKRLRTSFD